MQTLNATASSDYLDALIDDRERSAVLAAHNAWLEHSSSLARGDRLQPATPLDMLTLYRAAAATFTEGAADDGAADEVCRSCGRIENAERARQALDAISDPELARLVTRFANRVIEYSTDAAEAQDLAYHVELFLRCVRDRRVIDAILSGAIARQSRQLADPNYW